MPVTFTYTGALKNLITSSGAGVNWDAVYQPDELTWDSPSGNITNVNEPWSGPIYGANGKRYMFFFGGYPTCWLYNIDDKRCYRLFTTSIGDGDGIIDWEQDYEDTVVAGGGADPKGGFINQNIFVVMAPGSTSFWVISRKFASGSIGRILAVRYTITDDTTVSRKQYIYTYTNVPMIHCVFRIAGANIIDNTMYVACQEDDAFGAGADTFLMALPLSGSDVDDRTVGGWENYVTVLGFDQHAFEPIVASDNHPSWTNRAAIVKANGNIGCLFYVIHGSEDFDPYAWSIDMFDNSSGPRVYYSEDSSGFTDVSAGFGVPWGDVFYDHDGTLRSDSAKSHNNYTGPNSFIYNDDHYVVFGRPFADKTKFARMRLFRWNDGFPTEVADVQDSLWNPWVVLKDEETAIKGSTNITQAAAEDSDWFQTVSFHYDPTTDEILLAGRVATDDADLRGIHIWSQFGIMSGQGDGSDNISFSQFTDTSFNDWISADFTSFLDTWYHVPEDDVLTQMQTPKTLAYMKTSGVTGEVVDSSGNNIVDGSSNNVIAVGDGLLMQTRWDWSKAD